MRSAGSRVPCRSDPWHRTTRPPTVMNAPVMGALTSLCEVVTRGIGGCVSVMPCCSRPKSLVQRSRQRARRAIAGTRSQSLRPRGPAKQRSRARGSVSSPRRPLACRSRNATPIVAIASTGTSRIVARDPAAPRKQARPRSARRPTGAKSAAVARSIEAALDAVGATRCKSAFSSRQGEIPSPLYRIFCIELHLDNPEIGAKLVSTKY